MGLRKQLCVDCCCPPVVSLLYTTKSNRKECSLLGFVLLCVKRDPGWLRPTYKAKYAGFFGSERRKVMGKVSGKTHTKEQLDHWANLHNPNNKAYKANKSHQAMHNSCRRHKTQIWPDWAPDYPEYDD